MTDKKICLASFIPRMSNNERLNSSQRTTIINKIATNRLSLHLHAKCIWNRSFTE